MTREQAFKAGQEARANRLGAWQNPHDHFRSPALACAWLDGWLQDGKRTSEDTIKRLESRS